MIRPAGHNLNLQVVEMGKRKYYEVNQSLEFLKVPSRTEEVEQVLAFQADFSVDEASVIMERNGVRVRLPKGNSAYDRPFEAGWPRGIREVESERYMMNIHGTFYEMPREAGLNALRPVASHNKSIQDYCTWRGLLVLSGVSKDAKADGHVFRSKNKQTALWFGAIDDLWKLGKPKGKGGPWKKTQVKANTASDPYLMTGYDEKTLNLANDSEHPVIFTIEVDVDHHSGWHIYKSLEVLPGETLFHKFPDGYQAHWVRLRANKDCLATAQFSYR